MLAGITDKTLYVRRQRKHHPMSETRAVAFCPHCGNRAPQRLVYTHDYVPEAYTDDGKRVPDMEGRYFVAVCETCGDLLVYNAFAAMPDPQHFAGPESDLVWPKPAKLDESVPERVRECYDEAARIKSIAPNAFAVQIRRALEALCDDRAAPGRSLQERLQRLSEKGEIPPVLAEMTTILRLLGNVGAHLTEERVTPMDAWAIDDFFRAVIEYVYVAPSRVKDFRDRLRKTRGRGRGG